MPPSVPLNRVDGSWSLYWNFDQYLSRRPVRRDARMGALRTRRRIADDDANPLAWFLSFGVGGHNPMRGREADTFGAGWFVVGDQRRDRRRSSKLVLGPLDDGHGFEMFYNWQATPWLNITPDLQVLVPARENVDTALVLGVRAVMRL